MSLKDGLPTQEKLMPAKRYKVTLTHDERQDLLALVSKRKTAAYKRVQSRYSQNLGYSETGTLQK
jgi:hypothetical protein